MSNTVEIRPRLRLAKEVAQAIEEMGIAERSAFISRAIGGEAPVALNGEMERWCPLALEGMANVIEAAASGRLSSIAGDATTTPDEDRLFILDDRDTLKGWAMLLRDTAVKGRVTWPS